MSRFPGPGRCLSAALASSVLLVGLLIGLSARPAAAALTTVTAVKGEACSYYVNVGLFGGPQTLNGCNELTGSPAAPRPPAAGTNTSDPSYSPHVRLPTDGSGGSMSAFDANGGKAQYGPAVIHGGKWPCEETGDRNCPAVAPPSGPQEAATSGTPASGTVTASADIELHPTPIPVTCYSGYGPNCYSTGGFGPFPSEGDSLHAECTATETGVTSSVTFENAMLATSTDGEGNPIALEAVPDNPPANYTRHGVITNVGDVFSIVFNEQIWNPDGSLTVNAVHMYLFGPVAVGEVVRGQVTCGTTPNAGTPADTLAPSCGTPVVKPMGPEDPTPQSPRTELVGTFDAGHGPGTGIQSIDNIQVTNGTVQVADPGGLPYLQFTPGTTGPVPVTATRTEAAEAADLPMLWSFEVTDDAGNVSLCRGVLGATTLTVADTSVREGNAGTTPATFTITRWGDLSVTSTVKYKTAGGGTATSGTDFTAVAATTVTFSAGQTTKTATVNVLGDTLAEADETFTLLLVNPSANTTLADGSATGVIANDDGYAYLSVNDVVVTEGNAGTTPVTFTVTRSGNTSGASTVKYKTNGGTATAGTDYTSVPSTVLSFTAGQTSKSVTVNVLGDVVDEVNETFNLVLSAPTGATISDTTGTATIVDDDGAVTPGPTTFLSVNDIWLDEGASGTTVATFTVTRSGNTAAAGTVKYKTVDGTATAGTDYTAVPLTVLSFAAGQTSKTFTVNVSGDGTVEANEAFTVVLSNASGGAILSDKNGTATIVNDD